MTEHRDHDYIHCTKQGAFVLWHTWDHAWNTQPLPDTVFSPCSWKGKGRASSSKSVSSWLQTEEIEVNALYRCLRRAVYPSNVQTAKRDPRGHQFLLCIQLSLMLPFSQTHIKHLIHTNVHSSPSTRWQPPLHLSDRISKTSERERKKEVTKFTGKISVFRN